LRSLAEPASPRRWQVFAYVLGLSFSHHMMTVLLAPAFLFLYFATLGGGRAAWARIARAVPAFLLGLTPYLDLPSVRLRWRYTNSGAGASDLYAQVDNIALICGDGLFFDSFESADTHAWSAAAE